MSAKHSSKSITSIGNIVFVLGGPGTGKTTLCKLIAEKHNFDHFTIGELLFPVGKPNQSKAAKVLQSYSPLEIKDLAQLFSAINLKRNKERPNILLEGFVRIANDFNIWNKAFSKEVNIVGAFYLHCPEETMKFRLFNRDNDRIEDVNEIVEALNFYTYEDGLINSNSKNLKLMYIETDDVIDNTLKEIEKELVKLKLIKVIKQKNKSKA